MSEMLNWAKREIEIANKRAKNIKPKIECEYSIACYKSAFKAYKTLLKDGHSGCSISITKNILNRLIDENPLTPIEDTEDTWNLVSQKDGVTTYQCRRMSSLFKDVIETNGTITVKYNNINACYCIEEGSNIPYHSSLINKLYSEMFPITMPYMPPIEPDIVVCKEFVVDPGNGDFDTIAVLYIQKPYGDRIEINRYFKEANTKTGWKEIDLDEYNERACISLENKYSADK